VPNEQGHCANLLELQRSLGKLASESDGIPIFFDAERLVFSNIIGHMNKFFIAWPSQSTISKETGVSRSWVNKTIRKIVSIDFLSVREIRKGQPFSHGGHARYNSREYTLTRRAIEFLGDGVVCVATSHPTESVCVEGTHSPVNSRHRVCVDTTPSLREAKKNLNNKSSDAANSGLENMSSKIVQLSELITRKEVISPSFFKIAYNEACTSGVEIPENVGMVINILLGVSALDIGVSGEIVKVHSETSKHFSNLLYATAGTPGNPQKIDEIVSGVLESKILDV
jgi:hypothetical protein